MTLSSAAKFYPYEALIRSWAGFNAQAVSSAVPFILSLGNVNDVRAGDEIVFEIDALFLNNNGAAVPSSVLSRPIFGAFAPAGNLTQSFATADSPTARTMWVIRGSLSIVSAAQSIGITNAQNYSPINANATGTFTQPQATYYETNLNLIGASLAMSMRFQSSIANAGQQMQILKWQLYRFRTS